jgi:Pyruvate/2-oxoacid:ferredoxin oxidoreductase delta subunit
LSSKKDGKWEAMAFMLAGLASARSHRILNGATAIPLRQLSWPCYRDRDFTMPRPRIILSGRETPATLGAIEQQVVDRCMADGFDCLLIPHVYHIAESSRLWKDLSDPLDGAILLCWLHPRPVEWLLRSHQISRQPRTILNLAEFPDAASVIRTIAVVAGRMSKSGDKKDPPPGKLERLGRPGGERWYPVLDGSRCANCQHCLQFCLFGVYELDSEGKVTVRHPDHCKPGCPACSRICPQGAIMFPLYEKDQAVAGAPGEFVTLDADARKMFYMRTGQRCPVCGQAGEAKSRRKKADKGVLCPECGRPGSTEQRPASPSKSLPYDDLDELVDRLDQKVQRKR